MNLLSRLFALLAAGVLLFPPSPLLAQRSTLSTRAPKTSNAHPAASATRPQNKDLKSAVRTVTIKRKGVITRYKQRFNIHLKHPSAALKAQLASTTSSPLLPSSARPLTASSKAASGTIHPQYGGLPTTTVTSQAFGSAAIGGQPVVQTITYAPPTTDTTLTPTLTAGTNFSVQPGSCSATACTASVTFSPKLPGQLIDALSVTDSAGNLVDQIFLSGVGTGPQFAFLLGNFDREGELVGRPSGVAFGPDGSYYVVDQSSQTILKQVGDSFSIIHLPELCNPAGIAVDGSGTVYIADPTYNRVLSYTAQGLEGVVKTTPLLNPSWIAVDGTGALYISDNGNGRIIKIDNRNAETTVLAGLNAPAGIAVDPAGNIFFADAGSNGEIKEFQAAGTTISIETDLGTVQSLALDAGGRVFYTTSGQLGIINPATGEIVTTDQDPDEEGMLFGVAVAPDGRIITSVIDEGLVDIQDPATGELDLSDQQITTTTSDTITIANSGNTPLTLSSVTTAGPVFTIDQATVCNPEVPLAPGSSCDVKLDFTPPQAGFDNDTLTATSNSLNAPGTQGQYSLEGFAIGVPTLTSLTVSPTNGPAGATVTFTAVVSQTNSNQSFPPPTGTVEVFAYQRLPNGEITDAQLVGSVTLETGSTTAVLTNNQLASASYAFFASYAGDSYNAGSQSDSVNGTVGIGTGSSSDTLTASATTLALNQPLTLTVTLIGQNSAPTGQVTFYDDEGFEQLSTVNLTITGNTATASLTLPSLTGGNHYFATGYVGDANYAPMESAIVRVVVTPGPSSTTLTLSPTAATSTQTLTLMANVTSGTSPAEEGLIYFSDETGFLGYGGIAPTGTGGTSSITVVLPVGTHQITAQYTDDQNYATSTSTVQTIVITPGGPTLNLTASAANINVGQTEILTLQVGNSSDAPAETGTVTFSDQNGLLGTATVCACAAGPFATLAISTLTPGVHQITATYDGDANYAAATSNTQTVTVGGVIVPAPTATSLAVSPGTITVGQPVTLTASVTATSAPPGTVTFSDQNGPLGTATLGTGDSTSQATLMLGTLSIGTHQIVATYSGNPNFAVSTSLPQVVVVTPLATQVITFPSIPSHIVGDAPFSLAATASSGLPITYAVISGPATISGSLVTLTGAAGAVVIQASQAGDGLYAAAAPVSQSFNVSLPSVLSLAGISPNSGALGSSATLITLTGTDFSTSDVVLLNGTVIPSTYIGPTTLSATLPASFFAAAGTGILTVKDSSTQTITAGVTFTVSNSPQIVFTGPTTAVSAQQPALTFQLVNPYPVDLAGTLALTFVPSSASGIDDPSVQFSSGGRNIAFSIPADSTVTPPIQLQTGTVAGTATISLAVTANGVVVTPADLAPVTIVIPAAVPAITSTKLTRNGDTLTVSVVGYSNTREATQATFHFNAVPGGSITNADVTLTVGSDFQGWYVTPASDSYGSAFTYTQNFTLDQGSALIQDVTVTLTNTIGDSAPALTP